MIASHRFRATYTSSTGFKPFAFPSPIRIGPLHASGTGAQIVAEPVAEANQEKNNANFVQTTGHAIFKSFSQMAAVAPMAMMSGGNEELFATISKALDIYLVLLTVRVLLTWFRTISWGSEPFNTLRQFTDPYLNLFRGVIPPIGGMDLSPMLGFFLLSFAAKQLRRMSFGM